MGNIAQWGGWGKSGMSKEGRSERIGRKNPAAGTQRRLQFEFVAPAAGGARRAMREPWPAANRRPSSGAGPARRAHQRSTRQGTIRGTSTRTGRVSSASAQPAKSRPKPQQETIMVQLPVDRRTCRLAVRGQVGFLEQTHGRGILLAACASPTVTLLGIPSYASRRSPTPPPARAAAHRAKPDNAGDAAGESAPGPPPVAGRCLGNQAATEQGAGQRQRKTRQEQSIGS